MTFERQQLVDGLRRYVVPQLHRLRKKRDPKRPGYRPEKDVALEVIAETIQFIQDEGAAFDRFFGNAEE